MGTNTCQQCQRPIPAGRRYCTAHYQQALEVYHEPRGYARLGAPGAQNDPLAWYAICFGAMVGGTTWLALRMQLHMDNLRGLGVLVACLAASTLFPPVRRLVGRYMRLMVRGVLCFGVLAGLVFLLSQVSHIVDARSSILYWIAAALGIAFSIFAELRRGRP